jgi:outer membrane immunogenic protein
MRIYFGFGVCCIAIGLAVPAAAGEPVAVDWSGFYAGVNGGYGAGRSATTNASTYTDGTLFGITPGGYNTYSGSDYAISADGGFGGIQVGYNALHGNFVAGWEADFDWSGIRSGTRILGSEAGPTYDTAGKLDWFGTLRGRAGITTGRLLFYGTAGLAYGHATGDLTVTPGIPPSFNGEPFFASDGQMHVGYAVGAGVEAAVTRHVSLRLEYLYMDLGRRDYHFAFADSDGSTTDSTEAITENLFRVGLNYRF